MIKVIMLFTFIFMVSANPSSEFDKLKEKYSYLSFLGETNLNNLIGNEKDIVTASVYLNSNTNSNYENLNEWDLKVKFDTYDTDAIAYIKFKYQLEKTGWDFLTLSSYQGNDSKYSDDLKSYAMGFIEGIVTAEKIWNHYTNQKRYYFFDQPNQEMPHSTRLFLQKNADFIREMGREHGESDSYWYHAHLIHRQLEGMLAGYNSVVDDSKKLKLEDLNVCNARGDLTELSYYNENLRPVFSEMTHHDVFNYIEETSHCSALIKVAPDFSDVWFGHNTWTNFSSMMRIFKEYRFRSNKNTEKSRVVAFSGYPGVLTSIDDFYITDQDLFVTETTNTVFDTKLYDLLTPRSLLTWLRSILANRLSSDSKTWTETFSKYNSGTYNNQFQILDLKLIDTEKKIIHDSAFWIIEQIPGKTQSEDMTNVLRYGYWPSYNSAYFKEIRKISGYDDQLEIHPELKDSIDYSTCARANIFRRDQSNIHDLESYKRMLRYNDYKNDPFSKKNPSLAIACRGDLDETKPNCRGATDAKVASIHDIKGKTKKKITIISGPTNEQQTPFDFLNTKCNSTGRYSFNGLPNLFYFPWIEYETELFDY